MAKAAAAKKPPNKSQIIASIAESTGLSKKDVSAVFESLATEIHKALGKNGPGSFTIPGLIKVAKKKVDARPAKKNVMVLGQLRDLPAKPAYTKVTVRALKGLKDMV